MTISGISSLDPSNPSLSSLSSTDPRNTIRQLFSAVETGDLSAAQQAYDALTQNSPAGTLQNSTIGRDVTAIGDALTSGDVSGAQQALSKLQEDLQAAAQTHKHHHGHHHHGSKGVTDASTTPAVPDPNDPTSLIGTTLSVKA
jgi:hypothetical protein